MRALGRAGGYPAESSELRLREEREELQSREMIRD